MEYISANRLKNEIKRQITESKNRQTNLEKIGQESAGIVESSIRATLKLLLSSIDFLQQEHPEMDLKEDIKSWFFNEISSKINVEHTMYHYFQECAHRYYNLGLNARKEENK